MRNSVTKVRVACSLLAIADFCTVLWLLVTNECHSCARDESVTFAFTLNTVGLASLYWPICKWHKPRQNCCFAMIFMGISLTLSCISFVELFKLWHAKYDTYYILTIIETVLLVWYIVILFCIVCIAWRNNCYDVAYDLQNQIQAAEMAVERAEAKRIADAARPSLNYLEATFTNELVKVTHKSVLSGRPNDIPLKTLAELEQWEQGHVVEPEPRTIVSVDKASLNAFVTDSTRVSPPCSFSSTIASTTATTAATTIAATITTATSIASATTTITTVEDTNCIICMVPFTSATYALLMPCKHVEFHQWCINKWLRTKGTCPICRQVITTIILPGDGVITDQAIAAYFAREPEAKQNVDTLNINVGDRARNRNILAMAYVARGVGNYSYSDITRENRVQGGIRNATDANASSIPNIIVENIV